MGQEGSKGAGGLPGGGGGGGGAGGRASATATAAAAALQAKGIKPMSPELQRKLREGTRAYNMKVVIRGDESTGKSALLKRLEGGGFVAEHHSTPCIQVATINWNYKTTDEVVKVEVWDIVDSVRRNEAAPAQLESALDATTVDVYKGTTAVVLMVDPTRRWTFQYAQRELARVPKGMEVLLLVNFRDLEERRVVPAAEFAQFMRSQPKNVKYQECSVKNCFGLRQLYTFLNIPFLRMKQDSLRRQLAEADQQLETAEREVDLMFGEDYDTYLKGLDDRRGSLSTAAAAPQQQPVAAASAGHERAPSTAAAAVRHERRASDAPSSASKDTAAHVSAARDAPAKVAAAAATAARPTAAPGRTAGGHDNDDDLDTFDPGADDNDFFADEPRAPAVAAAGAAATAERVAVAPAAAKPQVEQPERWRNPQLRGDTAAVDVASDAELSDDGALVEAPAPQRSASPPAAAAARAKPRKSKQFSLADDDDDAGGGGGLDRSAPTDLGAAPEVVRGASPERLAAAPAAKAQPADDLDSFFGEPAAPAARSEAGRTEEVSPDKSARSGAREEKKKPKKEKKADKKEKKADKKEKKADKKDRTKSKEEEAPVPAPAATTAGPAAAARKAAVAAEVNGDDADDGGGLDGPLPGSDDELEGFY